MNRLTIFVVILCVCAADEYHTPVEVQKTTVAKSEDEELNSVDEGANQLNVKLLSYSEEKLKNIDQAGSDIQVATLVPEHQDESTKTSTISVASTIPESIPDTIIAKKSGGQNVEQEREHDSKLSDIPADSPELPPDSATDHVDPSNDPETSATTVSETSTEPLVDPSSTDNAAETTSETLATTNVEPVQPGVVHIPSGSTVKPDDGSSVVPEIVTAETETHELTTEISFNPDEMNRRKTSVATTTEKIPQEDTPPYPPVPSIPTDEEGILRPRPPTRKGQLDIRISIPHIFHLSLGETPDGRRRLGIQSPFFRLDLTKPRLKVFKK